MYNSNITIEEKGNIRPKSSAPNKKSKLDMQRENEELKELAAGVVTLSKLTVLSIQISLASMIIGVFAIIFSSYFSNKDQNKNICNHHQVRFFNN